MPTITALASPQATLLPVWLSRQIIVSILAGGAAGLGEGGGDADATGFAGEHAQQTAASMIARVAIGFTAPCGWSRPTQRPPVSRRE